MFDYTFIRKKNTYVFIGGFHLGLPLAFIYNKNLNGWSQIAQELTHKFLKYGDLFELVADQYESETKFPLGNPIIFRHKRFFEIFNLPKYLSDEEIKIPEDSYKIDNRIWVFPTGIVFIIGCLSVESDNIISLSDFENKIVENHYPELSFLFVQVAQIIFKTIRPELINSAIVCKSDLEKCLSAIKIIKGFEGSELLCSKQLSIEQRLRNNQEIVSLLSDILIDVYYFHYHFSDTKEYIRIGYVDSEIISDNPSHLLVISIAYSSFVGFLWIVKHLGEQSRSLQDTLIGTRKLHKYISRDLKLFRIFCLRFINESSPINVRLTSYYMIRLEECWREFRLVELAAQVNDQLQTLEKMFDWIEEDKKETRNFKIGLAAILLALISISAVTAQLISTIDFAYAVSWNQRVCLVLLGFLVGILCTVFIYLLPHRKNWKKFIKSRKKY